jgi:DNA-binding MarR family transcriptional regulator
MTTPTPAQSLAREIGTAERTLRALLDAQLAGPGLTFPEWTILVTLAMGGPLAADEVVSRQLAGRTVGDATEARAAIDRLRATGLVSGDPLALTAAGEAVFRPIQQAVAAISDDIYGDLPPADLDATRRTLIEVTRRAGAQLTAT